MKVLVIDDSAFNRSAISGMLRSMPGVADVITAVDGLDGYREALRSSPDVIMLDLEMPNMDGLTFLRLIKKESATPVIVVSGLKGELKRAVGFGAADFIEKPEMHASSSLFSIGEEIKRKLASLSLSGRACPSDAKRRIKRISAGCPEAFAIGASTGGPRAVSKVVSMLPASLSETVIIAVHMPNWLTVPFVERLRASTSAPVSIAADNEEVKRGGVIVCPGGRHLEFTRKGGRVFAALADTLPDEAYAPSVDRLFSSAALAWGPGLAGVVMTGMGSDGASGISEIKRMGGYALAESIKSATAHGMPMAAVSTGLVDEVLSAEEIGAWMREKCAGRTIKMA